MSVVVAQNSGGKTVYGYQDVKYCRNGSAVLGIMTVYDNKKHADATFPRFLNLGAAFANNFYNDL